MTAHNHAALMAQYAEDALETDAPWERWEQGGAWAWETCPYHPSWLSGHNYRRKPPTININGFEVPEPCCSLGIGDEFYWPAIGRFGCDSDLFHTGAWTGHKSHRRLLGRGLLHRTREAAELHAKALLSFTQEQSE